MRFLKFAPIFSAVFLLFLQFIKAERRNIPASMFEIPAGYEDVKEGL